MKFLKTLLSIRSSVIDARAFYKAGRKTGSHYYTNLNILTRAVAIAFAREGADLLISYFNEHEDAKETAKYVEEEGRKAFLVPGDIQIEAHCQQIVDKALQEFCQTF